MPLVKAVCTNCGGALEVDSAREAAICPHCKQPYIVEKAINSYTINQTTNIAHVDVLHVTDDRSAKARLEAGNTFLDLLQYDQARTAFEEACKLAPQNYMCWWGQVLADIRSGKLVRRDDSRYLNALRLAPAEIRPSMEREYEEHRNSYAGLRREDGDLLSQVVPLKETLDEKKRQCKQKEAEFRGKIDWNDPPMTGLLKFFSIISFVLAALCILSFFLMLNAEFPFSYVARWLPYAALFCALAVGLRVLSKARVKAKREATEKSVRCTKYYEEKASAYSLCAVQLSKSKEKLEEYKDEKLPEAPDNINKIQTAIDQAKQTLEEAKRVIAENEKDREPD